VPQVASETKTYALSHSTLPVRPQAAPGHTPASAFESMLDENAQAAVDRSKPGSPRDSAPAERNSKGRPAAESKPAARAEKSDDAKPADSKATDSESADSESTDIGQTHADAQADSAAQTDRSGETETDGESKDGVAHGDPVKTAGQSAKPEPAAGGGDGQPADDVDDTKADAGKSDTSYLTAANTEPAVAPTPPAAAHSENAAHAADAAEGRTPLVAAAALQAAASKPADAQAKNEDKKAAPGLPQSDTQSKAGEAPKDGEKKPAAPQPTELPAQAHRNAPTDSAVPPPQSNAHAAARAATDVTQPLTLMTPAHQQQPAPAPTAAAATPQAPAQAAAVPLAGVAIEIAGKALAGKNRFEIRLDPPELGRIEVRLDVDRDGRVTSHLVADRKDTLNLLQRDAAGLQRALQDAGLKTADNGLQFSLRDQSTGQHQEQAGRGDAMRLVIEDETLPILGAVAGTRFIGRDGGIDIRV